MKFYIREFFKNLLRKFNSHKNLTRITGTLHEDQYTLLIISRPLLFRMRNVSGIFVEKIKGHILHSIQFSENLTVYETM
jgi:hypothetical protein